MYYKVYLNGEIVDAMSNLQYIRYYETIGILRCGEKDTPQGIISTDAQHIWHVENWPDVPEKSGRIVDTVQIVEIEEEEYLVIRALLDEGKEVPNPGPEPEPEVDADTLSWAKQKKIELSKTRLAEYLEEHPIVSTAHGGAEGIYSVTEEKQQLMALNYSTYQIKKTAGIEAELTWNETGKECEVWTEAEYVQLIIEIEAYVKPLVSKQQAMEKKIQEASTLKEVEEIEIIY